MVGPSVLVVKDLLPQDYMSELFQTIGMAKKAGNKKPPREPRARKDAAWNRAFGARLKQSRGARTQEHMAVLLDVPVDTYQSWEQGKRTFPIALLPLVVSETKHGPWLLLTGQPDHLCPAYIGTPSFERPIPAADRRPNAAS